MVCRPVASTPQMADDCKCLDPSKYTCHPNHRIVGHGTDEITDEHSGYFEVIRFNGLHIEVDCMNGCESYPKNECAAYEWRQNYSGQYTCLLKTAEGMALMEKTSEERW